MVDIGMGLALGKGHIETQKAMTEMEQHKIAEMVQMDLEEKNFPCHVEYDGSYRVMGMKIQKLKIIPDRKLTKKEQLEFDNLKEVLAKKYGKMRRSQLKEEKKKLKKQMKKNE